MQRKKDKTTFYCFSPPVMIATFVIEIALLIYTLWRYKFNTLTRLAVALLFFLAVFQLAEFRVCTGDSGLVQWSHIGYVAITLLPALGIHALNTIKGKAAIRAYTWAAYVSAAAFVAYFALSANSLNGHQCLGNYVIFQVNPNLTWLYGLYYYGWVIGGVFLSITYAQSVRFKRQKRAFYGFAAGYAAFLVPTATVNLLNTATRNGIPSIMCGFAVSFALILSFYVMPQIGAKRAK